MFVGLVFEICSLEVERCSMDDRWIFVGFIFYSIRIYFDKCSLDIRRVGFRPMFIRPDFRRTDLRYVLFGFSIDFRYTFVEWTFDRCSLAVAGETKYACPVPAAMYETCMPNTPRPTKCKPK